MAKIRKFHPEDASRVKKLIADIMGAEFPEDAAHYPQDDLDDIPKHYDHIGEAFFVAHNGRHEIVGTIGIKRDDERRALIRRFFVAPSYRGKKLGRALLDHCIDFCRQVGYQEIMVKTTTRMKRAIDVCHAAGFVERGHVDMGGVQLCRLTLFLKENSPLVK